ncbi:MAG: hypothetical protein PHS65_03935, partial [Arcobacteraceae bacterium]|nr:hypothetical protein [Arcobacteraceae bacterium]
MIEALFFGAGLTVGCLIIWLILKQKYELIQASITSEANLKIATLQEKLESEQNHFSEKQALLEESKRAMKVEFENLV